MYNVKAFAVRKNDVINVTVIGCLPNSCYEASVVDKYPGGNVYYVVDPGSAQVFIEEIARHRSEICPMSLVPWIGHVSIPVADHDQVTVFVNGDTVAEAKIQKTSGEYRVIALAVSSDDHQGCSVIPADAPFLAIYSSVFGPKSKKECDEWLEKNCSKNCP